MTRIHTKPTDAQAFWFGVIAIALLALAVAGIAHRQDRERRHGAVEVAE